jgi:hypothetical protein
MIRIDKDECIQLMTSQVSVPQNFDKMIIETEWKNDLLGAKFKIKIQKPLKC